MTPLVSGATLRAMLAAALAVVVDVAWAQEDAPRAALTHAVQRYLAGDTAGARTELQALLALGPSLPPEVRQEALLWLGDLLYAEGGPTAARNVFEALLGEDPDFGVDPFAHAPEMVAYFEEVRATFSRAPPILVDPPVAPIRPVAPWRWKVLIPGGIGYFVDKKPVAGAVVGGLQAITFAASVGTWIELTDRYPTGGQFPEGEFDWPAGRRDAPRAAYVQLEEFNTLVTLNQVAFTAAVLSYLVPIGVETGAWATQRRVSLTVTPTAVTFSGQF